MVRCGLVLPVHNQANDNTSQVPVYRSAALKCNTGIDIRTAYPSDIALSANRYCASDEEGGTELKFSQSKNLFIHFERSMYENE